MIDQKIASNEQHNSTEHEMTPTIMNLSPAAASILFATLALFLTGCGSSKSTPQDLGEAVQASDHERVQAILAEGVSPDITNAWGVTPLLAAVMEKDARMVTILLEGGADPNIAMQMGMTPIHHAVVMDMKEIVPLLLEAGADPTLQNEEGKTALQVAEEKGREEVVDLLRG